MWRRLILPVLTSLAVVAGLAFAQGSPYALPEPAVTAAKSLRLPAAKKCVRRTVRLNLLPPAGVTFASLSVRVGSEEVLQLADLAGPGSLKIVLPSGRSRVRVSGTTSGGQFVASARSYRRCPAGAKKKAHAKVPAADPKPEPKPKPPSPPITGGGED